MTGDARLAISVKNHVIVGAPIALDAGLTADAAQISLGKMALNANQTFTAPTANNGVCPL